jgi:CheY-like chemotaxis protein
MARILLIDDDRALLDVLCMAMEDEGHTSLSATDGREGLQIIRSAPTWWSATSTCRGSTALRCARS